MIRKFALILSMIAAMLLISACAAPTVLVAATPTASSIPSTAIVLPTNTPLPATPTETSIPTPTITVTPTLLIPHFPVGQEFTISAIRMIDTRVGWAIGGLMWVGEHVLRTTDGGTSWIDLTPPEEAAPVGGAKVATGYFQDTNTAWVTYADGSGIPPLLATVWRTQDGGLTWQRSDPLDTSELTENYYPSHMQFVSGGSGWLMVHVGVGMNHDYIVLYRSSDGGQTWDRLIDPYNDTSGIMSCTKNNFVFTDATHGWLTGDCGGVAAGVLLFRTSDGGATWERITLPDPTGAPGLFTNMQAACGSYDPFFFSTDVGHIGVRCSNYDHDPITYSYYVFTTPDNGNTWSSSPYPGEVLDFITADIGWSFSSKVQHTTDGGLTWVPISDVTWSAQPDFVDEKNGWVIARGTTDQALVRTSDGGAHWELLTPKVGE